MVRVMQSGEYKAFVRRADHAAMRRQGYCQEPSGYLTVDSGITPTLQRGIHPPIEVVFAFLAPDREAMLEALTRAWFTRGEVERLEAQGWRVDVVGGANIPRAWRYVCGTMFTGVA